MQKYSDTKLELKARFETMSDFEERSFSSGGVSFSVFYIQNLSSRELIDKFVLSPLVTLGGTRPVYDIISHVSVREIPDAAQAASEILSGACVAISSDDDGIFSVMTKSDDGRSPSEPETENVIRGAHEGFTENGGFNAALIRRRIKTTHLKKEDFSYGDTSKTTVSVMYLDNVVRDDVLCELKRRLSSIEINGILDSGYVEAYIQDGKYSVYPTIGNSERPDKVASKILEGRIAIIVDGSPVVLTAPFLFVEGFQVTEDYSKSVFFATFERSLRFIGTLASLYLPALLLALNFGGLPGTFFSEYLERARADIKIPLMAELVFVFLMFELVREVGLRMPKAVGSAVGIVGSLVIGDSAVEAGIISAPVLIVVAFSAVCNFLAPPYMNSNVIYRAALILAAGFFGPVGFFVAVVLSVAVFASKTSLKTPYLSPLSPFSARGQGDFLLMLPIWKQKYVPDVLSKKRKIRSKGKKSDE